MSTIASLVVLLALSLLGSALALWLLARLFKAPRGTFARAALASLLLALVGFALSAIVSFVPVALQGGAALMGLGVVVAAPWLIGVKLLGVSRSRAAGLTICYLAAYAGVTLGLVVLFKSYVVEAFVVPTSSNAPTLLGYHHIARCPHCQGRAVVSAAAEMEPEPSLPPNRSQFGICTACRKISEFRPRDWDQLIEPPDRFLCDKLLSPRRWDLIVFVHPRLRDSKRVCRLVGLPGEKVHFDQGRLMINDQVMAPPESIRGLEYLSILGPLRHEDQGPWQLGPEELFVVGDFSTNSSDSREYGPIPRASIEGVATIVYSPFERRRFLRE